MPWGEQRNVLIRTLIRRALLGDDEAMDSDESRWALIEPRAIAVDGDRVAYRTAGKGPLLLLVHGMAGSSETWRHVMPALAERFRVLAPDLLGQGQSDKPRGDYSLGAHANTLRDLMDSLGHERATVVGQSLGGGVAMQFVYQFPELCERLVLVDSGGLGREVTFYLRMLTVPGFESVFPLFCTPRLRNAGNRVATWLGRAGARSTPASQEIWRSYASLADAESRRAFFRSLREVIDFDGQAVSALRRLYRAAQLPTLIVWGRAGPVHSGEPRGRGAQRHAREPPRNLRRGGTLPALRSPGAIRRGARRLHDLHGARPTAPAFDPTRWNNASQCRRSVRAGVALLPSRCVFGIPAGDGVPPPALRLALGEAPEEPPLHQLARQQVGPGDREQQQDEAGRQRHESEQRAERRVGQEDRRARHEERGDEQQRAGPAPEERPPGADHQHDEQLRHERLDEPAGLELPLRRPQPEEQRAERQVVEHGAHQPEHQHEVPDEPDVPAPRPIDLLAVHVVGGDGHRGNVGQEVVEQDLLRQERQERKEERRARHAHHVAEVRAGRDEDVLERVGERLPAQPDALREDAQVPLQQHDVGRFLGDVHRALHRDPHVCRMQRARVVDPVAQVADHVAGLAERRQDPLLLVRLGLREDVHLAHPLQQRGVAQAAQLLAGEHGRSLDPHLATHLAGDETVVPRDDLQLHAELPELGDGLERVGLRRVLEQQEADEGHLLLVVLVDDRITGHVPDGDAEHAIALLAVGLEALLQRRRSPRRSARCGPRRHPSASPHRRRPRARSAARPW